MNHAAFDVLLTERIQKIKDVLGAKGREYASEEDRLSNFKNSAAYLRCTPAEACIAFMTKHLTSVMDIVVRFRNGETIPGTDIDEKIGDAINYLILLEAILHEVS